MSDNHRPTPDVLEQAAAALRDAPVPAGPPADLTAATIAAVETRLAGTPPAEPARTHQRRARIMRYLSFSATAAAVLVAVFAFGGRAVAMDKVLGKAAKAEVVRYEVRTESDRSDHTDTVTIRDKVVRVDGSRVSFVIDPEAGGMIILSHPNAVYQTVDLTAKGGGIAPFDLFATRFRDQLAALQKEKFEAAGKEKVGDVKADKFTAAGVTSLGLTGDWTVWVDPNTELPVKIGVEASRGGKAVTRTYSGFDWKPEVNAADFTLDAPEGYTEGVVFHTKPALTPLPKKNKDK
jgi:hypothetical protein